MIQECICPNCNKPVNNWWENSNGIEQSDDGVLFIDYPINCKYGHKFIYTEWYRLFETTHEDMA